MHMLLSSGEGMPRWLLRLDACMQLILIQCFTDTDWIALLAAACVEVYLPTNERFRFCPPRHGCFAPSVGIKSTVESLRIPSCMQVILVQSFTDAERSALLAAACAVVYTPTNEHFGIVPLEAMAAGRPVLACNSGGPKETVLHGRTGFLAEPQPKAFAAAMAQLAVSAINTSY